LGLHEPSGRCQRAQREERICRGTIDEDEVAFASLVRVFKAYQSQDLTQTN
jgi:hypothetical protein